MRGGSSDGGRSTSRAGRAVSQLSLLVLFLCGLADAERPAQDRYQELASLLRASEKWAAKVQDKRLQSQLEVTEAKFAVLQPSRAAREEALSLFSASPTMSAAAKAWSKDAEFRDSAAKTSLALHASDALHAFDVGEGRHLNDLQRPSSSRPETVIKPNVLNRSAKSVTDTGQSAKQAAKGFKPRVPSGPADRQRAAALHHKEQAHSGSLHKASSKLIDAMPPVPRQDRTHLGSNAAGSTSSSPSEHAKQAEQFDIHIDTRPSHLVAKSEQSRHFDIAIQTRGMLAGSAKKQVVSAQVAQQRLPHRSEPTSSAPSAGTLAGLIVAPQPAVSQARAKPIRVSALGKTDSVLRQALAKPDDDGSSSQAMWRQGGSYPLSTIGGIPTEEQERLDAPLPLVCPQPMPTMLHNELHAMLCWTLQLADGACSQVWSTVPALYQDTVGMALRRRVVSAEQMQTEPTKVIYDVEEVQQGTTRGANMGSMAASSTYQGVAAAWEQHGVSIVHSVPLGMDWAQRWLGLRHDSMQVDVVDCAGLKLSSMDFRMREFAHEPELDQPPVQVASMSTSAGAELAVMRSALGGSHLGSLFELVDEDGRRIGIMVEEGRAGAWLIQLVRRYDVDIRVVSMLTATMAIAGQEQLSGFLVGLGLPLLFLLLSLAVAFCLRVKLRQKPKVYTAGPYDDLDRDRQTQCQPEAPLSSGMSSRKEEPRQRVGIVDAYQPSQKYQAPRMHPDPRDLTDDGHALHSHATLREDMGAMVPRKDKILAESAPALSPSHPQKRGQVALMDGGSGDGRVDVVRSASAASCVSDRVMAVPRATVEQYRNMPLVFPHSERPRIVSGGTAAAFRGVDEALAAVEAALAAHPRPGGEAIEDHALQGVSRALDVGAAARVAQDPFEPFTINPSISAERRLDSQKRFQNALLEHKMDDLATGPLPGLGQRPSVLTDALLRGSAASPGGEAAEAEHRAGAASTGWRVDDFRKAHRARSYSDHAPSLRSELLEAGAGRLSPPAQEESRARGDSAVGYPKSISEWSERNAFAMEGEEGRRGAARTGEDALSHPGLV